MPKARQFNATRPAPAEAARRKVAEELAVPQEAISDSQLLIVEAALLARRAEDIRPTSEAPGSDSAPVLHREAPINILIVDDEPKNLTVLEAILNDPGYRLVRAETAEQADTKSHKSSLAFGAASVSDTASRLRRLK